MKKWILLLTGVLLVSMIAAGCSSGNNSGTVNKVSPSADNTQNGGAKVNISLWVLNTGWEWLPDAVRDFEQTNPNISVEVTKYEVDPIKEALKVAASSKTLPDMWFTWGGSLGSFYAENGMTMDLTQVAADHKWSEIYNQTAIDMSTYDGKISGIPIHLNVLGMWYPKNVYQKLNLQAPATFAEFESQLQILKDNNITPLAFGSKGGWHTMRLTEQLLEHFAGPELHDKLNSLDASWNDPAVVKAFGKIKEYTDKGYFPMGYSSLDPTEAESLIYQEAAGIINEGTWFDGTIITNGFNPKDFDVFKFPNDQTPSRASVFTEMFQINAEAEAARQEAAIKFGEYLTSTDVINKYVEDYGSPAALEFNISDTTPHLKPLLDSAGDGGFLITDQALPQEVAQKLFEAQDKVALDEWTPQQAAEGMDKAVTAYKSKQK
ncbi:extracellular solute-binding protein [Paenibacillus albidus]|uniref:ABC transporter substrate-binding protein n=1 Tax=Paenibacillus albidus TaxID=2041023 RepID=UPI001BE529D4|nr:extracellular solute-binding protein [Paenibacillus albidus]MBT2291242.1 extracellular solute-binding protein [Paenibacillus albidus]